MEGKYKKILPEEVFITIFEREPTEAELWMGVPAKGFEGHRPTGNNFMDLFARLLRQHGHKKPEFYAHKMGLKTHEFNLCIKGMSGVTANEWIWRYLHLASRELLAKTKWKVTEVGQRLGFSSLNTFTRFFYRMEKLHPLDYRWKYGE